MVRGLLVDIGGVLLTNGWDHSLRLRSCRDFGLDQEELMARHALFFDSFERGWSSLETYLEQVIFYKPRSFTLEAFKNYLFEAASPDLEMIQGLKELKSRLGLRVALLSNEGRELAEDRIQRFQLHEVADLFIISGFVHYKKPDAQIYELALDLLQLPLQELLYIDDRKPLIERAEALGIPSHHHQLSSQTLQFLRNLS